MNSLGRWLCLAIFAIVLPSAFASSDSKSAAAATNQLGVDLYKKLATGAGDLCLSPYSIESALAMTLAGAEGETRSEMARVLHLSASDENVPASFAALRAALEKLAAHSSEKTDQSPTAAKHGGESDPITLAIANRLFAQRDYQFRESFLALVKTNYGAPMEPLDFKSDAAVATEKINAWVADQTHQRIENLIPVNALNETTRMVLANALYLKAPWSQPFEKGETQAEPFHLREGEETPVPMMHKQSRVYRYAEKNDFVAISLPYRDDDLRFVILLPKEVNGLTKLEANLSAEMIQECASLNTAEINLSFPKFKLEPPTIALEDELKSLGMKTAFDDPQGSANFDRLAPRQPNDYLYISNVFHKTFIAVDEEGTEAAAATAVAMARMTSALIQDEPIEVKVDRPFLYFIQQASTGVCLFLGRVTDPRK